MKRRPVTSEDTCVVALATSKCSMLWRALASGNIPELVKLGGIGSCGVKYEGLELAVGLRPFIDDMRPEGLLHGAFKLADHARADIVAIDTSAAEAVEGVERVLTAADVPGALRVGLIHKDWPIFIPVGGRTSYLGDVLAMVVAGDRETARAAAELVDITYDVLPPMVHPADAVASGRGRRMGVGRQRAVEIRLFTWRH